MSTTNAVIGDWLTDLGAKKPTPGGGAAAAVGAAIGAAVAGMAAIYTTGKKWADRETEATALAEALNRTVVSLLELADEDAAAYAALQASWKATDLSAADRQAIEARARQVPLRTLLTTADAAEQLAAFLPRCNPRIISDLRCGIHLLGGAGRAAAETLAINEPPADDRNTATAALDRLRQVEDNLPSCL